MSVFFFKHLNEYFLNIDFNLHKRALTLGEVLDGDRMAYSLYNIKFLKNEKAKTLCSVTLGSHEIEQLKEAIRELYYFEFSIDDLRK